MAQHAEELGTNDIRSLLIKQAVPASVGILFMTVNILIDTILVGRWIGPMAIAALAVVTPVMFLTGSLGLAVGIGGSSVISRALGSGDGAKARVALAHQIAITFLLSFAVAIPSILFSEEVLELFGAKGRILEPARIFLVPIMCAAPLQALCSMSNSVIRAEGKAKFAMISVIIASAANIILDVLFIKVFGWGIFGAGLATAFSFVLAFLFVAWFFFFRSTIRPGAKDFNPNLSTIKEISALSFTTFARQGVITILSALLNNTLFDHGGERAVTTYGIISRMLMFALFPVNGIAEGFLPVAGYNYGAEKFSRVRKAIITSVKYAGLLAILIYAGILIFSEDIIKAFTSDKAVATDAPDALRWVFAASPVIAIQLIGSAYFQAAGKPVKALILTLTKQGFFLIPLILILPEYFGIFGIWVSFPIADVLATIVTGTFLGREMATRLKTSDGNL